jgi:hypothetical protein
MRIAMLALRECGVVTPLGALALLVAVVLVESLLSGDGVGGVCSVCGVVDEVAAGVFGAV